MNPPTAGPADPDTEARQRACPCHHGADCPDADCPDTDCPDHAEVTIPAAVAAALGGLLTDVDEFLRCGDGVAERLADSYAHRGHPHPRFAAANLIDAVGFAALGLRRRAGTEGHREGGGR